MSRRTRRAAGERVVLRDGRAVTIRPIRVSDLPELRRALREADPETLHRRFLGGRPPQSTEELRRLVTVDHVTREALVAIAPDGRGVGIARYEGLPEDEHTADVAVAVDPQWRRVGLASALLVRLATAALHHGVKRVQADYYATNADVADLLRRAGVPVSVSRDAGVVEAAIELDPSQLEDKDIDLSAVE